MGGGPEDAIDLTSLLADGETDIDAAWAEAFYQRNYVYLPEGIWRASSLTLGANKWLLTDGAATVIQQKAGLPTGTRIINIIGSGARLAPGSAITLRGNIATDTGEHNHGVFIRGTGDISNIVVGDVVGEDIRGDVVYVGGLATARVDDVTVGDISGSNILRSVISVTGVETLDIGNIQAAGAVGYMMLNIEPDGAAQSCKSISVGEITGGRIGVIGQTAAHFVEAVTIASLDLGPSHTPNSAPPYSAFASVEGTGLWLRNCRDVAIGSYKARDFEDHAIKYVFNGGEMVGDNLAINSIDWANCNWNETTYNTQANILNTDTVTFGGGSAVLPVGAGKRLYAASLTGVDASNVTVSVAP